MYKRQLQAFKKGVYNYIQEDKDFATQQMIPRKYFSGGFIGKLDKAMSITNDSTQIQNVDHAMQITVRIAGLHAQKSDSTDHALLAGRVDSDKELSDWVK